MDLGHWRAAVEGLAQRIAQDDCAAPGWKAVQVFRPAHAHFRDSGETAAALRAFSLAIRSNDDGWRNCQRANCHAATGRKDEAREDLAAGARHLPHDPACQKAAQALIATFAVPHA